MSSYNNDDKKNPADGSDPVTMTYGDRSKFLNAPVSYGIKVIMQSGSTLGDASVSSGGIVVMDSGSVLSGVNTVYEGGKLFIWPDGGGTVYMDGSNNSGLIISGLASGGTASTVISGFNGHGSGDSDRIEIAGVLQSDIVAMSFPSADQIQLSLQNGTSFVLNITGIEASGVSLSSNSANGYLLLEVCFLAGSMIATPEGDRAVEELRPGDIVNVFDHETGKICTSKITWAGQKDMLVRPGLAEDLAGYPVRVLKDAIAPGVPYKDLLVTSEHCMFFDGNFVPVRMLVNGRSVFYDHSLTGYTYYHIETESHSVIWANGMLTESYLDTGNRSLFAQYGNLLTMERGDVRSWDEDAAAPLTTTREHVEPIFRAIEQRAVREGIGVSRPLQHITTDDSAFHLVSECGATLRKVREANGYHVFMIPPDVTDVRMVSRASRPSDAIGAFVDDRRSLGVLVGDIRLFQLNDTRVIDEHLQSGELKGWDTRKEVNCRWTTGNACLSLGERKANSVAMLAVQVLAAGPYLLYDANNDNLVICCGA
ncbi:Hint domain-containing protein [Acetobacter thailandicus]|uniref:Hint domain-containing protein n=1 Tax=Acetobacter thailandicus TaxID=1502842 RepID=UPI001BABCD13|nr:Hint domain-containing protein [Acetobacter thailandicus]MBS0985466.1 Hint domain-containing protein [Acetobacter thailandicus]